MSNVENSKKDIQGLITSAYGHTLDAVYLFMEMTDVPATRQWLVSFADKVTTAASWRPPTYGEPEQKEKNLPPRTYNIAFTIGGLDKLGIQQYTHESFPLSFQEGMTTKRRSQLLGDIKESAPDHWEIGGINNPKFDLVLILHSRLDGKATPSGEPEPASVTQDFVDEVVAEVSDFLKVIHDERGYRRPDNKELFGFHDGIGQPKISGINIRNAKGQVIQNTVPTGEFILGYKTAYDLLPQTPVVRIADDPENILPPYPNPEPLYPLYQRTDFKDLGANGTFVVYRKFKQNTAHFWNFLKEQVMYLYDEGDNPDPHKMIDLAAKFVGRRPDGAPLVPGGSKLPDGEQDEFTYKDDPHGLHCPYGSHLRRTNPRDFFRPIQNKEGTEAYEHQRQVDLVRSDQHRIIRRGRLFGDSIFDLSILDNPKADLSPLLNIDNDEDDTPHGLHFLAINADIQRQFEFLMESWINNGSFNAVYQNKGPLLGNNDYQEVSPSSMEIPDHPVGYRTKPLQRFVDVMGGVYLFMPSITALRYLASID